MKNQIVMLHENQDKLHINSKDVKAKPSRRWNLSQNKDSQEQQGRQIEPLLGTSDTPGSSNILISPNLSLFTNVKSTTKHSNSASNCSDGFGEREEDVPALSLTSKKISL